MERRSVGGVDTRARGGISVTSLTPKGSPSSSPGRLTRRDLRLGAVRRLAGRVDGERHDRIEARIEARDRGEMGVEHLDRAHRPRTHHRGKLDGGSIRVKRLVVARHHFPDQWTNRRSIRRNIRFSP